MRFSGFGWGTSLEGHIEIVGRVYKGTFDTPKGRKGKRTARKAALSTGTAMELAHGLGVSMEVYPHSDLEQKSEAVNRLESEVIQ